MERMSWVPYIKVAFASGDDKEEVGKNFQPIDSRASLGFGKRFPKSKVALQIWSFIRENRRKTPVLQGSDTVLHNQFLRQICFEIGSGFCLTVLLVKPFTKLHLRA
jgi:hypothetical protein